MLRVMPEASHASPVKRGESRLGRPDLYLLQWAIWMGLQGALRLKVDCVSTEQLHKTPERKKGLCVLMHRFTLMPAHSPLDAQRKNKLCINTCGHRQLMLMFSPINDH